MQITSYPQIFTLGHKAIIDIFKTPVIIEEKIDGSQFSFRRNADGSCEAKSKGAVISLENEENIPKLFLPAVKTFLAMKEELIPGLTYRGEALHRPTHNVLAYSRMPEGGVILFDVETGGQHFLDREDKELEAERLGLEVVPVLYQGMVTSFAFLDDLLQKESCLGGVKIEGVVVKNYNQFVEQFKTIMLGKFVSEAFKEKHRKEFKQNKSESLLLSLITQYRTEARWQKAVQHLRERGELTDTPQDIGKLLREVNDDVLREEKEEIKEILFKRHWKEIASGIIKGFPEWYKEQLAKTNFTEAA